MDQAGTPSGPMVVMANLLRPLLLDLARTMPATPEHLIVGGLLKGEVDDVVGAFADSLGLHEHRRRERGEWAAAWLGAGASPDPAHL